MNMFGKPSRKIKIKTELSVYKIWQTLIKNHHVELT